MTWIESHASLARHPKTIRLAKTLDISVPCAIGHLHLLWWWSLEYAQEGDLSGFDPEEVAEAAGYDGDGGAFVAALQRARFVDDDGQLHDWQDYAGRLIERRQANTERMRNARVQRASSIKEPRAQHVRDTFDARAGATVPNRTVPNQTEPDPLPVRELVPNARARLEEEGANAPPHVPENRGGKRTRVTTVTEDDLTKLVAEFASTLGGEAQVREVVALALSHQAAKKYSDQRLYVRNWLRHDAERLQEQTNGSHGGHLRAGLAGRGAGTNHRIPEQPDDGFLTSIGL